MNLQKRKRKRGMPHAHLISSDCCTICTTEMHKTMIIILDALVKICKYDTLAIAPDGKTAYVVEVVGQRSKDTKH